MGGEPQCMGRGTLCMGRQSFAKAGNLVYGQETLFREQETLCMGRKPF